MENIVVSILFMIMLIAGAYLFGKFFAKGFFKELDTILGKKFTEYINNKKQKEDGKEKK